MRLTVSKPVERELNSAIDEIVAGKFQRAVDRLCRMLGVRHVPEVSKVRKVEVLLAAPLPVVHEPNPTSGKTVTPIPKPPRRVVDRDLLAEFRQQFPTCAVRGCGLDADPHHLVRRSEGGSDAHENLLALCPCHHTGREGWHTLTPDLWVPKYSARLGVVERCKIRLALEIVAARKTLRAVCDTEGM